MPDPQTPPPRREHLDYLLTAYLFESLSSAGRREVEKHLAHCAACRQQLEDLRGTFGMAEAAFDDGKEYVFEKRRKARVLEAARAVQLQRLKGRPYWKWAAVAALLVVGVMTLMPTLGRSRMASKSAPQLNQSTATGTTHSLEDSDASAKAEVADEEYKAVPLPRGSLDGAYKYKDEKNGRGPTAGQHTRSLGSKALRPNYDQPNLPAAAAKPAPPVVALPPASEPVATPMESKYGPNGPVTSEKKPLDNAFAPLPLPGSGGSGCFLPGTLVSTAAGPCAIEEISPGTLVQACDPASGRWEVRPVSASLRHEFKGDVVTLEVESERIQATGNHPFWVEAGSELKARSQVHDVPASERQLTDRGRWVEARDLREGDTLSSRHGPLAVRHVSSRFASSTVWNLTVNGRHTYAVSTLGILVHNKEAEASRADRPALHYEDQLIAGARDYRAEGILLSPSQPAAPVSKTEPGKVTIGGLANVWDKEKEKPEPSPSADVIRHRIDPGKSVNLDIQYDKLTSGEAKLPPLASGQETGDFHSNAKAGVDGDVVIRGYVQGTGSVFSLADPKGSNLAKKLPPDIPPWTGTVSPQGGTAPLTVQLPDPSKIPNLGNMFAFGGGPGNVPALPDDTQSIAKATGKDELKDRPDANGIIAQNVLDPAFDAAVVLSTNTTSSDAKKPQAGDYFESTSTDTVAAKEFDQPVNVEKIPSLEIFGKSPTTHAPATANPSLALGTMGINDTTKNFLGAFDGDLDSTTSTPNGRERTAGGFGFGGGGGGGRGGGGSGIQVPPQTALPAEPQGGNGPLSGLDIPPSKGIAESRRGFEKDGKTAPVPDPAPELKIYDVRDLTKEIADFPGPAIDLKPNEKPKSPDIVFQSDGAGDFKKKLPEVFANPQTSAEITNGKLVVLQTHERQRQIEQELEKLRAQLNFADGKSAEAGLQHPAPAVFETRTRKVQVTPASPDGNVPATFKDEPYQVCIKPESCTTESLPVSRSFSSQFAEELYLRSFQFFREENPKLTFPQFLKHPDTVPPLPLSDEGLGKDAYVDKYGIWPFIDTSRDHLSTFGMDVDTASYTLAKAALRAGRLPDPNSIHVEEFVNSFTQDYRVLGGEAFGVFAEAAQSPFVDSLQTSRDALEAGLAPHSRELLKIGIKSRDPRPDERKAAMLTFVIDTSGSMNGVASKGSGLTRIELVKQALRSLVGQLNGEDAVSIVGFDDQAKLVLPRTPARLRQRILDAIDTLSANGGTRIDAGLLFGFRLAEESFASNAVNRLIYCGDGASGFGTQDSDEVLATVRAFAQRGIDLSTVGIGMEVHDDPMLRKLADTGNGSCHYANSLAEAETIFASKIPPHLSILARDAKVQVDFDPDTVKTFRLLGYEKRKIADKDFRNDKIDAGEVGHSTLVTVFYELVRNPGRHGPLGTVYLRWKDAGSPRLDVIERHYPLEEAIVAGPAHSASPDFRFLASVARFGELLRNSRWVRHGTYAEVLAVLDCLPEPYRSRPQVSEVRELVATAQRLSVARWKSESK